MSTGEEATAPAFSFIESTDQDKEVIGGCMEVSSETGDLVAKGSGVG